MGLIKATLSVLLFSQLAACASIVSHKSTPVTFNSSPPGAKIEVTDRNGVQRFVGQTPATTVLDNGDGYFTKARYSVKLTKEGYEPQISSITPSMNGWYWGNIIFGGLIGMLIVDPITGAMYEIDQPALNLVMAQDAPQAPRAALAVSSTPPAVTEEAAVAAPAASDIGEKIKLLEKLKSEGLLTDKEFVTKKKELLDRI